MLLDPHGKLWLANEQGTDLQIASLDISHFLPGAPVRVAYSWDTKAQVSHLSAHNAHTGEIKLRSFNQAPPLSMDDLARILFCNTGGQLNAAIDTFLLSDQIEKLGYFSGIGSNAQVETESGPVLIGKLKPGDLVVTHDGDLTSVVATLASRTPTFGRMRPVELRRPFLNLAASLSVSPDASVVMEGSDAEYYFGCETVSINARYIAPFTPLPYANSAPLVTLHQLVLQDARPFRASGAVFMPLTPTHDTKNAALHTRTRLASIPPEYLQNAALSHTREVAAHYLPPRDLQQHEANVLLSERYL
jgi:hypothetical protein